MRSQGLIKADRDRAAIKLLLRSDLVPGIHRPKKEYYLVGKSRSSRKG